MKSYAPVELLDIMPTLYELMGLSGNQNWIPWDGLSLVPVMKNPNTEFAKRAAHSVYWRGSGKKKRWGYSLRTTRYRFTAWCTDAVWKRNPTNGKWSGCITELYDYFQNPWETVNVFEGRDAVRTYFTNQALGSNGWSNHKMGRLLGKSMPFDFENIMEISSSTYFGFP